MSVFADDFSRLARACVSVAERAVDPDGFVPVRNLLRCFSAKLILRPLLVEAMLCELDEPGSSALDDERWAVLVDSERYPLTAEDVEHETSESPLSVRFRNTVAHELAHSLSFRLEEFGVRLAVGTKGSKNLSQAVDRIEKATERLSPILLIPPSTLDKVFPSSRNILTAADMASMCDLLGVSRYVLINRLGLLSEVDGQVMKERACFRNMAVGIGEVMADGSAYLKGWPLYRNFDGGITPTVLLEATEGQGASGSNCISDPDFFLNRGTRNESKGVASAGTGRFPRSHSLKISCSVDRSHLAVDKSFLFVMTASPNT